MYGVCKGIEFSAGRCELWTRPEGIGSATPLSGFTCLRFKPAPIFQPVDGGKDRVCRGATPLDNAASYFIVEQDITDIRDCQNRCMLQRFPRCIGIEYSMTRCELWVRPGGIQASLEMLGSTCMRLEYDEVMEQVSGADWVYP